MYVMNYTRPNISYSFNKLSKFTSNLSIDHYKVIKRYLNFEVYLGLWVILYWLHNNARIV